MPPDAAPGLPFPFAAEDAYPGLATLLARIEATYRPEAVLLFGSRARGDARDDSDWDIAVLLPAEGDEGLLDPVVGWLAQRGSGVHADVLAAFVDEFVADLSVPNTLAHEVSGHAVRLR